LRVHIEEECSGDPLDRARHFFGALGMHQTRDDTGVLLYVSPGSRQVAIYAGTGIHKAAGASLWTDAVGRVATGFRDGDGLGGIEAAILIVGEAMARCAPGDDEAGNELPDEITTS
jgi:uncharacterized membrane protein